MMLLSPGAQAAERITPDHIRQVIAETDAAAKQRDVQGIGEHLGEKFSKGVEVSSGVMIESVQIDKQQYLQMIAEGWGTVDEYSYDREDTVITIAPDGLSGESNSTITETVVVNGEKMVSKVREYARYELENGKPVIVAIEGLTLVGDTTPEPQM
jgi:phosphotransferase system IIA component